MKTPLPEKVGQNTWVSESTRIAHLTIAVNQLIDVVAELTEVVESVNTREVPRFIGISQRIQIPPPPSLKETLLQGLKFDVTRGYDENVDVISWEDVKSKINKLMP